MTEVPLRTIGDLRDVYGYLVEPAFRRNLMLIIQSEIDLASLDDAKFIDPDMSYQWTLQRLRWIAERYRRSWVVDQQPPMTPIEALLFEALRAKGLMPHPQYGIRPYRADFAFPEERLVVECDGRYWHDQARDQRRDEELRRRGWEVFRLSGSEITRSPQDAALKVVDLLEDVRTRITYSEFEEVPEPLPAKSWWHRLLDWLLVRTAPDEEAEETPAERDAAFSAAADFDSWTIDEEQQAAVLSHDGAVQIIAPAGSGKTLVVVKRVRELIARGVPGNRILCTTFNRAAADEMAERLSNEGARGVAAKSFHAVGFEILKKEGLLRKEMCENLNSGQWKRLIRQAKALVEEAPWIDAAAAKEGISELKLVHMVDPEKAIRSAHDPRGRLLAHLYDLYERELEGRDALDYDDLIMKPVVLLRTNRQVRERWQRRWEFVLVDEYQDIEPAQELLVRILAAPQDGIFTVGDEDQCIYAWRRADVERIIDFDKAYPGLDRAVLRRNYRCASGIVKASAKLIAHNKKRFPKEIVPVRQERGVIQIVQLESEQQAGEFISDIMARVTDPSDTVVLARTTNGLGQIALVCARHGVPFRAPEKLTRLSGAERTVMAYLTLFGDLRNARAEDVDEVFRIPNRYLPDGAEVNVAAALRDGSSFSEALATIGGELWRRNKLEEAGRLFEEFALVDDADLFVSLIRTDGGLDRHYTEQEDLSPHDMTEMDSLDELEQRGQGKTRATLAQTIAHEHELLRRAVSDGGIELTTIHGAKGRQWRHVILVSADDGSLPHSRAVNGSGLAGNVEDRVEEERRLAYVAFTRAQEELTICFRREPSRFLKEAGLMTEAERLAARQQARRNQGSQSAMPSARGLSTLNVDDDIPF